MMLPLLGLLDILETTVKYVNKALLPLLVLAFGLGAVAQVMILFTRFGGLAIVALASIAAIGTIFAVAATALAKRAERARPAEGLPPMRRWIVDPEAPDGLREVAGRKLGE